MTSENLDERMLSAWLRLTSVISNERLVSGMPYNEALICHILQQEPTDHPLTATDLCEKTRMLKSQMNRTLNSMEEKRLIVREQCRTDHRKVYITMNEAHRDEFEQEHQKNLRLVDELLERFGRERGETMVGELNEISAIAEEIFL